jgi:poly-gamma-glutamate synthesis protein (capsule biosynthesis protein)
LVHYGLGNLFFDQMTEWNRRAFIDRHVIYDGRLISTELLTVILEDYSQPRLMTGAEREVMLYRVFKAAGWLE